MTSTDGAVSDPERTRPLLPATAIGLLVTLVAFIVYWLSNQDYDAGRGDLFYLADAFLHGRTWVQLPFDVAAVNDVIVRGGHVYVPFAPFPAIVLVPLVALVGPFTADQLEPAVNAMLAATVVGLSWWLAGRIGVRRLGDRLMLAILMGFSTQIWWVATRGGVWHTGHLVATILTFLLIAVMFDRKRPLLIGLLVGAGFLTRAPLAFAGPVMALWMVDSFPAILGAGRSVEARLRAIPWAAWGWLLLGFAPALVFFFWYNLVRFDSLTESGYALASLPPWLEAQRQQGLFSLAHVPMNLNYLFLKLPTLTTSTPFLQPDGLGMSVLFTTPGLLLAVMAPWRDRRSWLLLAAAAMVLVPTLLYYGGGWLQFGYRYFLDSIPFVWTLVAMGVVRRGSLPGWGRAMIWFGVIVMLTSVYWAYNL